MIIDNMRKPRRKRRLGQALYSGCTKIGDERGIDVGKGDRMGKRDEEF